MADSFSCPHCEADVPRGATVCPACGSDKETGWSDAAAYQDLFPFLFVDSEQKRPSAWPVVQRVVSVGLVIALGGFLLLRLPGGIYLLLFLLIFGGVYLWWRERRAPRQHSLAMLRDDLLRKARGDEALVERWIAYERKRRPSATLGEWMRSASERWERDNR